MEYNEITKKWNSELLENAVADVDKDREKFFLAPAFPYPNSPQHIGHGRTYTTTDIYCRYQRLLGKNVLFPMGFHVTGTPIIAMAKRLKERDREIIDVFTRIYEIPYDALTNLEDPESLVMYFSKEIEEGMKEMCYSIDWRRKFYSFDSHFNRFIEWQFKKLYDKGYLVRGTHPVAWCRSCNNALGAHDTKGDKDPELEQVYAIVFPIKGRDFGIVVATYRPETLFGVTNIWVREGADYVIVENGNSKQVIAEASLGNLSMQQELKVLGKISSRELLESVAINPITGEEVVMLPASFVDPSFGTGLVMSVPAHAPYDYLALRDLGFPKNILPKVIIDIPGMKIPAKEVVERLGVKDQNDPLADTATKEVYKLELEKGKMLVGYPGLLVSEARERVKEELRKKKHGNLNALGFDVYIIANHPVYCRCGTLGGVKIVRDQWFIDYGNKEWKELAKECLKDMSILPEQMRKVYEATLEWLDKKACTRENGLGTRFPFDRNKMIEALSDSTIYMAFYTIAHKIKRYPPEQLDESFFDYIFLGKGNEKDELHKELKSEFEYWYPLDSRHSGSDLVRNHLTFFILNHVAVFQKKHWPRKIVTNGFVLMDGKKMSKSMGNILPLRKAIKQYSSDVVRFAIVYGADLDSDTDFNEASIQGIKQRLAFFDAVIQEVRIEHATELRENKNNSDNWLLELNEKMKKKAEEYYQQLEIRKLCQLIFYDLYNHLKWYEKRNSNEKRKFASVSVRKIMETFVQLIYPFMPCIACEWYSLLYGVKTSVVKTLESKGFPETDKGFEKSDAEVLENTGQVLLNDVEQTVKLSGKQRPSKITLIVADDWKRNLIKIVKEEKNPKKSMERALKEMPDKKDKLFSLIQKLVQKIDGYPVEIPSQNTELSFLREFSSVLENIYNCKVEVISESEAIANRLKKSEHSSPLKPAILVE